MAIVMYDLAGADGRRFSPYCWRTRMALAHKGLEHEARGTDYAMIGKTFGGAQKTLPVIDDGGRIVGDSTVIADYLEATYPDRPSLFGGPAGRALTRFVDAWTAVALHSHIVTMVMKDIHDHCAAHDHAYFRQSREQRFGRSLEELQAGRENRLEEFRAGLTPLRLMLRNQPFLGGETPVYADYIAFGAFQWGRAISEFRLVETDDPVWTWLERCRDLHGGLARNATSCY